VATGVGQQPGIDLVWSPDTEPDLAGYNIYRREEGGQPEKINKDLVKAPSYRDTTALPGHTYFYSVSAIDVRGNESARSEEAHESMP
jgi:fibronectin type 3 domain-containing protein